MICTMPVQGVAWKKYSPMVEQLRARYPPRYGFGEYLFSCLVFCVLIAITAPEDSFNLAVSCHLNDIVGGLINSTLVNTE